MRFKTKRFFTTLVLVVCLVLFVSMYMMMNNIDETLENEVEENDKVLLLKFKDNIMKLKEQLDANEAKINDLKDLLARAMSQNFSATGNFKQNQAARTLETDDGSFPDFPKIECPLSRVPVYSQAVIQMSDVFEKLAFDNPDGGVWKQGYPISYNTTQWNGNNKLHVFVIPHSHTDPGWIKTFEQYYTDQTSHILNNMVENLERNPRMRFIYAEMSFFSLWWSTISQRKRDRVSKLLKENRLEIVTGGWVMTDEANSHYSAMLDQMIEGNQWLKIELGYQPKSAWSIDPFGYSPTMSYLLKRMSFKHMLIQRVHYTIKKEMSKNRQLEFFWRQGWDATGETDMFCHMMPFYSYDVPHTCGPDPMICCQFDFKRTHGKYACPWKVQPVLINEQNVEERAEMLLDQYRKKSQLYKNNVVLIPLGDDFRYDTAEEWNLQYDNYVKLFDYMNGKKEWNVEAKFATLSDYFEMLERKVGAKKFQDVTDPEYQTLSGDFFVYADRDQHYWSGYFTSRPYYKKLDRELEFHQRTAEILFSLALAESRKVGSNLIEKSNMGSSIVTARRSLGLFQHHDGITGTAKDHVVVDYGNKMVASINSLKQVITASSALLLSKDKKSHNFLNRTIFDMDETREHHYDIPTQNVIDLSLGERMVYFHNSLAQARTSLVTVHVTTANVEVKDTFGNVKVSQVDPVWEENERVSISSVTFKLSFIADVPALGFSGYTISSVDPGSNRFHHLSKVKVINNKIDKEFTSVFEVSTETVGAEASIENENYLLVISTSSGLSKRLVEKKDGQISKKMEINFVKYGTAHGREKSGAYLFLPDGEAKNVIAENPDLRITEGPLSSEAISRLPMVVHTIRLMSSKSGISGSSLDILNMVDIRDESNTELAMRITTEVSDVDGYFYTDLNGFQIIRRRYYSKIPLQGNIYPMSTVAYLENVKERFTLLTGQSLGVASLKPGELEVMQDRRLNQDDNRGVEQGVLDNKKTPNKFKILFEEKPYPSNVDGHVGFFTVKSHFVSLDMLHPFFRLVVSLFSDSINKQTLDLSFAALLPSYTSVVEPLPCDLHLVNLRMMIDHGDEKNGEKLIVRPGLENALILHRLAFDCGFEAGAFGVRCGGVKTSLKETFSKNTPIKEMKVMSLNLLQEVEVDVEEEIPPMELRAYRIQFGYAKL